MVDKKQGDLAPGTVLDGRYEIQAMIGRGGMGEVYRAKQVSLDTLVALKVLQGSLAEDELQVQRFSREALACSRLKHPNTIRVLDFGRAQSGHLYLAMELLEGRTLSRVVRQEAPLDPQRVVRIALQITKSIGEAHDLGLVHRDLKPANIFLCDIPGESDFVKVLDFGIAKFVQSEGQGTALTQAGLIIGTPLYLAPEQATARAVTPRSDLYSLGVILYHMICGAPPFQADTPVALLMKHVGEPPPPFGARRPGLAVPAGLASLVFDLLEKDPKDRPESARVVGERLRRALVTSVPPLVDARSERAADGGGKPEELRLDDEEEDDLDLAGMEADDPLPAPKAAPAKASLPRPAAKPGPTAVPAFAKALLAQPAKDSAARPRPMAPASPARGGPAAPRPAPAPPPRPAREPAERPAPAPPPPAEAAPASELAPQPVAALAPEMAHSTAPVPPAAEAAPPPAVAAPAPEPAVPPQPQAAPPKVERTPEEAKARARRLMDELAAAGMESARAPEAPTRPAGAPRWIPAAVVVAVLLIGALLGVLART